MMYDVMIDFIEKYFWNGIKYDTAYNWIDMLVYALLFVGAVWLLYEKFCQQPPPEGGGMTN
ncbi:Uncharacterised protein [uncultured archaeon]|nr:Uncharacterised protein [uncultured archaeon]